MLDVPRTDFGVLDALEPLTVITLVVNQELPTVRRAAQIAALLRQRYGKDKWRPSSPDTTPGRTSHRRTSSASSGCPSGRVLPSDYRKVIAAANAGRPLVSDNHSRLATSVVQFARELAGVPSTGRRRRQGRAEARAAWAGSF